MFCRKAVGVHTHNSEACFAGNVSSPKGARRRCFFAKRKRSLSHKGARQRRSSSSSEFEKREVSQRSSLRSLLFVRHTGFGVKAGIFGNKHSIVFETNYFLNPQILAHRKMTPFSPRKGCNILLFLEPITSKPTDTRTSKNDTIS